MTSLTIPAQPGDLTAGWITSALREGGALPEGTVRDARIGPVGAGVLGQLFRAELTYDGAPASAPRSVVVKLPAAAPQNVEVAAAYGFYRRELDFYRLRPSWADLPVPRLYHGAVNADGRRFALVLEDLGAYRAGNQVDGADESQFSAAADLAALMHGQCLGRLHTAPPDWLADGRATHVAPTVALYGGALPRVLDGFGKLFSSAARATAEKLTGYIPRFWDEMNVPPVTLVHGDFRLENLLFGTDDTPRKLCVVDFQLCVRARAGFDLGYLMSQSAPADLRRSCERRIIEQYHRALLAHGAEGYDLEACVLDYRRAVLYCLVYPVIVCGQLDASNESARAFGTSYLERALSAIEDTRGAELL